MAADITIIHHALNAGEVSPRMTGRQDQNKYLASCEVLQNAVPLVLGGAYIRPGTKFVTEAKDVTDHPEHRLIDFVAARDAAYVLEFGHEYVRFFADGLPIFVSGTTPLELTTPYDSAHLGQLFTVQSVDVMYLLHRFYPVQKIQRTGVDTFTITEVNFDPPATIEEEPTGTDLGAGTLTPAATTGNSIDFTAQNSVWLGAGTASGDVGRLIIFGGSRAVITSITSGTVAVADIIDDFPDTNPIPADDWRLRLSPQGEIDITNDRKFKGQTITITATNPSFRAADVGKFVTLYGGSAEIFAVTDDSNVEARITADFKDVTVSDPAATRAWTLEVEAWSTALGFPSCGCFFQERLWLCKGLTVNGSRTGDYENFSKGADADDAIARTLSDDDIDVIVWIKGYKTLKVGTGSGIFECSATQQSGALTPASFKAEPIDPNGGARIAPLRVTPVLVYVQAGQRELRELAYSFADDAFKSPRLFRLADHLVDGFFLTEIHYASQPDSIILGVRNDGVLLGCVYEQVESVIGWFRVVTDGLIESMCVIPRPSSGKDWWWICVERDNGTFIEFFEPDAADTGREWFDLHTDAAVIAEHDANLVVSGLDHLEGQTVWVVGDGMLFNVEQLANNSIVSTAVVTGGEITLDPPIPVHLVEVGLGYEAIIVPVEPAVPAELGGPFIARGYAEIGVRIRRALGLTMRAYRVNINEPSESVWIGEQLVYRKPYHNLDQQVPLQRGKKCIINMGYDPFSRIEVKQNLPFPAEILNVVGRLHLGDRWDCDTYNDSIVNFSPEEPPPPPGPPEECVDATERGQQTISIEDRFDQQNSFPPASNIHTSWGFINAAEEVSTLVGNAAGSGGNMAYNDTDCQRNDWDTPLNVTHPALIDPDSFLPFLNTIVGTSDEPIYGCRSADTQFKCYFPNSNTSVAYALPAAHLAQTGEAENTFCKVGTSIYFPCHSTAPGNDRAIVEYTAASGVLLNTFTSLADFLLTQIAATASFLYVLATEKADSTRVSIKKLNRSDGTVAATFMLDNIAASLIGVVSNNLIYVFCNGTTAALYYVKNFNTLVFVGRTAGQGFTPFGNGAGLFVGGAFYYGYNGIGGFSPDIFKITIACPDGVASVASIDREDDTVAAGDPINVSWADVLEPDASDEIQLRVEPTPGDLGFSGAPEDSQVTDGLGTSTMAYTIPALTTPGNYVFMFVSHGETLVAVSPAFEVT